jgi:FkbM family methyltransferase
MHPLTLRARNKLLVTLLTGLLRRSSTSGLVRLGTDYGGWWVPESVLRPGAVAYCAGAGEDITFDSALVERGLTVRTFDPTPRAIAHVNAHGPVSDRFTFIPVGWWGKEDTLRFYSPQNPAHVSHSAVNLQRTNTYFEAQVRPVAALMNELGDEYVDLIKMDIEGAEYQVLDSLLVTGPLPAVLCVEFDQPQPIRRLLGAVRRLRRAGYELRQVEQWNYTFSKAAQ